MSRGEELVCPEDFGCMPAGWYLNHSSKGFNAVHKNFDWFADRDILAGEEILIDYNALEEPLQDRSEYYQT